MRAGWLAGILLVSACTAGSDGEEAAFAALQERGAIGMGVDQYASTHLFDALPWGGRIEFQFDGDDPEEIAVIRAHLREIQAAFAAGDFSTPAFVHDREVPGTATMAARSEHIRYVYYDLPRGGELRLVTTDPEALEAIAAFMAFQRDDHRAGGVADHAAMDHSTMDHGTPDDTAMDHAAMDHAAMDHSTMDHGAMDHSTMDHSAMGHGAGGGQGMDAEARHAQHLAMGGGDEAFAADMDLVHELLVGHTTMTRTVEFLPNGIRTLTESSDPAVAGYLSAHVASMEARLQGGESFNLFSETIPVLFEHRDLIRTEVTYTGRGVAFLQTSDDPEVVRALQAHADEVTEFVDEGMAAMMRGMMGAGIPMEGMPGAGMPMMDAMPGAASGPGQAP